MRGLGDHELVAPASDAARFAKNHALVVVSALDTALGLRDDLLGHHEDVPALKPAQGRESIAKEAQQVIAGPHFRDAKEGQNPEPAVVGQGAHPSSPVIRIPAFAL